MAWLIQRTAPCEPVAYWGRMDRWMLRRAVSVPKPRIPEGTRFFDDYDVALDLAEWLRTHQPLAHGEVISVVDAPAATP